MPELQSASLAVELNTSILPTPVLQSSSTAVRDLIRIFPAPVSISILSVLMFVTTIFPAPVEKIHGREITIIKNPMLPAPVCTSKSFPSTSIIMMFPAPVSISMDVFIGMIPLTEAIA